MPSLNSNNDVKVTVSTTADTKGIKEAESSLNSLSRESENSTQKTGVLNGAFDSFGRTLRYVGQAFVAYQLIDSVRDFGTAAIGTAAELEQTNMSFQSLIGNTTEANKLFGQLVQYANVTPFQSKDVTDAAKQLLAFGATADQTTTLVKQLGDVASSGGGDLQAMSLVTGQIFAQGKLRAQDMYQVINDGGAGLIKIMADNVGGMQNLTKEFDTGGIPAKQYFDAVTKATALGGFAFQGADKQAQTLNGRISTLKDSAVQFGEALIGVHTDPQLGLQIQPGGLFDRLKGAVKGISDTLAGWQPAAQKAFPEFLDKTKKLYDQISDFLGPSLKNLWKTVSEDLIPAMSKFWKNIIEPLIPVIGGTFMVAVKAAVDILNDLFKIITPVINFMADHKTTVELLAGAFVLLRGAMMLQAAFDAIMVGMATLQLVTFPAMMATLATVTATWVAAFPVAGILADIGLVYTAIQSVLGAKKAVDNAYNAAVNSETSYKASHGLLLDLQKNGTDAQKAQATKALKAGFATGTNSAPPGWAWVGEQGPELMRMNGGEQVKDTNASAKMARSSGGNTYHFSGNIILGDAGASQNFFSHLDSDNLLALKGMSLNRGRA